MHQSHDDSESSASGVARLRLVLVVVGVALALVLISSVVLSQQRRSRAEREVAAVRHVILTPVGNNDYGVKLSGDLITVSSPATSTSGNVRIAFWKVGQKPSVDQRSCAVWRDPTGKSQPGLALRLDPGGPGRPARGLIVTQNVWAGVDWTLNLLGMEVGERAPQNAFGTIDVLATLKGPGHSVSTDPWHVCAQVIGRNFSIKAWLGSQPEPSWTSKKGVWHLTVPADWVYSGHAGAYAAHLKPGASREFEDLTTTDLS